MKKYAFTFTGRKSFPEPVTRHDFLLRCMPGTYPFQRPYAERVTVLPHTAVTHITDVYGNEMYTGTVDKAHTNFTFEVTGFVLCSNYLIHEPLDRLFLYPTTLTRPTREMSQILASASLSEDPWRRARQLCGLVHRILTQTPRASLRRRTAAEVLCAGQGDAREQAHVLLTLCRLSGIPARFVNGLAAGSSTAHCWVEVYCGGFWRALDPTVGGQIIDGYLKISHGPDYNACTMERSWYQGKERMSIPENEFTALVTEHVITTRATVPHA